MTFSALTTITGMMYTSMTCTGKSRDVEIGLLNFCGRATRKDVTVELDPVTVQGNYYGPMNSIGIGREVQIHHREGNPARR